MSSQCSNRSSRGLCGAVRWLQSSDVSFTSRERCSFTGNVGLGGLWFFMFYKTTKLGCYSANISDILYTHRNTHTDRRACWSFSRANKSRCVCYCIQGLRGLPSNDLHMEIQHKHALTYIHIHIQVCETGGVVSAGSHTCSQNIVYHTHTHK